MAVSKILKFKTAVEIQQPSPKPFEVNGQIYPILPMPDGTLVTVAKEIGTVSSLLKTLTEDEIAARIQSLEARRALGEDISDDPADLKISDFSYSDLTVLLPAVVQILLPSAPKIIAAALRQPEPWVEDTLFYRDRLRALRLILEAEDIPLLVGDAKALVGMFQPTTL